MKFVCQFKRQLFLSGFTTQLGNIEQQFSLDVFLWPAAVATQAKTSPHPPSLRLKDVAIFLCHLPPHSPLHSPLTIIVAILVVEWTQFLLHGGFIY